jgi:CBS domain-containing protein
MRARDVMSTEVILLSEDLTAAEAVEVLRGHEISGAPVKGEGGKLVGVVSLADLAGAGEGEGALAFHRSEPQLAVRRWEETAAAEDLRPLRIETEGRLVRDVMSSAAVTVSEETSLAEVGALMVAGHFHRVVVVRGEAVVGIVSSLDVLRGLLAAEAPAAT